MHRAGSWPALLAFPRHQAAQVPADNYFFFAAFFLVAFLAFFLAAMCLSSCWWDPTDDPHDRREQSRYAVPRRDPLPTNV
jgi:hypothetical protein